MNEHPGDGKFSEIHFPDPDEPYLFEAAVRRHLGDGALSRAWVIPSGEGPTVLVSSYLLEDAEVRALVQMFEGQVADDVQPSGQRTPHV